MGTSTLLVIFTVKNVLLHSDSHINKMLPQIIHILRICLVDSLPQIFVNNCIEVKTVRRPEIWKFLRVSFIRPVAFSDWRTRMIHRMSGLTQLAEKIMTSKIYQN